jgi:PAS domain S-box-containing protein
MTQPVSPSLYQALYPHLPDAVIYADAEGTIQLWNPVAEQLFGFTAEQAIGQSLDIFIPEKLRARHWEGYRRAMASGATHSPSHFTRTKALHAVGTSVYVDMRFAVVDDPLSGTRGSVAFARACPAAVAV